MKRTIRKALCLLLLLLLFPMQTRGAVESETTAQSEKLRLDNENRYEGMEKAYQDGYEPEVSGESVSVILPLMWNGKNEVNTITASLDQGDQNTAPFIFQNYQKTFKKTEEKINDTDQTREVFLIKFVLKLKSDRKNGAYPVQIKTTVQLEEQEIEQNFTVYVQINDEKVAEITPTTTPTTTPTITPTITPEPTPSVASGISEETDSSIVPEAEITGGSGGEAVVAAKGENKEEKATSEPKVIVAGCKEIPEHIYAGDSVNLKVVLKNTNKKKYVQNMTVTVGCMREGMGFRMLGKTRSGSPSRNITLRFRKIRTRKIIKRLLTKIAIFTDEIEKSIISYDLYSNSFLYASNICCNSSIVSRAFTGSSSVSKSAETRRGFETVF